jgi:hypothetical protein
LAKNNRKEAEMDRQRIGTVRQTPEYHPQLLHAMGTFLPATGLPLQREDRRVRWTPRLLVTTALLMVWQTGLPLRDAFAQARAAVVGMYPSRRRPGASYTGFLAALQKDSDGWLDRVVDALRAGVRAVAGARWRSNGWVLLGVDGTRIDCARTAQNEEAFGCAGRTKTGPQMLLTTVFHVGTGLVWAFRRACGAAAERAHLRDMLADLPARTMLLLDAGYSGFDLLHALHAAGHDFIVRVGRNVHLLRKLGWYVREHDGIVYLWPQAQRDRPPLVVRLVVVGTGRSAVYLLTSVLDGRRLRDGRIARWYRLRWGVEVYYRSLKQTLQRRKMRSAQPNNALTELDWTVVGLWLLGLMTVQQVPRSAHWSAASALRVLRRVLARPHARGPKLCRQLAAAVRDTYVRRRRKAARDWPHKKNDPPCGPPHLRTATPDETGQAKGLKRCA